MTTAILEEHRPAERIESDDERCHDLVDGELVERTMGTISSWVGSELHSRLREYCLSRRFGWIWHADAGFKCFQRKPVRFPDVAVVRYGRLPGEQLPQGHMVIPPDFVAEVISPHDEVDELEAKMLDYRDAGVRLVWLIYPALGIARVHRPDRTITEIDENEYLDGESVLPGYRVRLRDLFPYPPVLDTPPPSA